MLIANRIFHPAALRINIFYNTHLTNRMLHSATP